MKSGWHACLELIFQVLNTNSKLCQNQACFKNRKELKVILWNVYKL